MTLQRNRVLALLMGLLLALGTLVSLPAHADAKSDSVSQAADWIAAHWESNPDGFGAGTLADGIIALSAAEAHPETVAEMLWALHEAAPGYVGSPDERPNPAGLAKIIMTLDMANQDPRTFLAERDLVEELKGYVEADANNVKSFFGPYLIAIALTRVDETVPANIIEAMTSVQEDGAFGYRFGSTFNADPDYTAMGISAMDLISRDTNNSLTVRRAANRSLLAAIDWTADPANQNVDDNGYYYWATYSAANSTGMLASALAEVGENVESPVNYLIDQQIDDGSWGAAHNSTRGNLMATTQAIMGPAGKGYGTIKSSQVEPIDFNAVEEEPARPESYVGACVDGEGVTVIVDFQDLGGDPLVRCAPFDPENGVDALRGAGFEMEGVAQWGDAFICRINDRPAVDEEIAIDGNTSYAEACIDTPPAAAYWSYWQSSDEGETWAYSQLGAMSYDPAPGEWEGWSFSLNATAETNPVPRTELALSLLEPEPEPEPGVVEGILDAAQLVGEDAFIEGTTQHLADETAIAEVKVDEAWVEVGTAEIDDDGAFAIELTGDEVAEKGTYTLRVRVGDVTSDEVTFERIDRSTSAVASLSFAGRDANVWGIVDGEATVSTQVQLPNGNWSTSQTREVSDDGSYVIPLTYGKNAAGTLQWRVRATYEDGEVKYTEPMEQTRIARTTASVAAVTVAGRDANLWGTVAGEATVSTQVKLANGNWSTSQTREVSDGGSYVIPLTYGKNAAGTLQWRVRVVHANGLTEYTDTLTQQRVGTPSAASAGTAPVGRLANVWGTVPGGANAQVYTQVLVDGKWSKSQERVASASGYYVIPLTYGAATPGTYRWRVAAELPSGVVLSEQFTFVRTR